MRYLSILCFCFLFAFQLNAQEDLDLNWGPAYNRLKSDEQHFFYLGEMGDHYYLRSGKDGEMLLHKQETATHKVVKSFSLQVQFQGLKALFDRFVYLNDGMYGYFKVPNPDESELILVVAPFGEEGFGELREVFRHEFIKIPAIFEKAYPFVQRDWRGSSHTLEKLRYSPDSSYVVYANSETPLGYRGMRPHVGYHVAVFGGDFERQQEMTFFEDDFVHGTVKDVAVNNGGEVYATARKLAQRSDWKGKLEGKNSPQSVWTSLYLSGENAEALALDIGAGKGITNMGLCWKPDGLTLQVTGLYTNGVEKALLTGYYLAEGNKDGLELMNVAPLATDMVTTEVSSIRSLKPDLRTKIVGKEMNSVRQLGADFSLLAQNHNADGSMSWVFVRKYKLRLSDPDRMITLPVSSVFLFLQTDAAGNLLNERFIDRAYVDTHKNFPAELVFFQEDKLHLMYPNMRSLKSRQALDANLKGGGLLEYLVLDASGETAHFEVLQSNLSYFLDFSQPIAQQGNHILLANLTWRTYSMGSLATPDK